MDSVEFNAWLEVAGMAESKDKNTPVVLFKEIYEYFDEPVKIVSVNCYGGCDGNPEVTVENRYGTKVTVDANSLDLRPILRNVRTISSTKIADDQKPLIEVAMDHIQETVDKNFNSES
jgi:hypothetical protein